MQKSNGCRSGIELVDSILFNHSPPSASIGIGRHALIHHGRTSRCQRSIDDVCMPRNPSNIGSTPVGIFLFDIEYPLHRQLRPQNIASLSVLYPFWFASTSRSVEQKERIFAIHNFRLAHFWHILDKGVVVVISTFFPADLFIVASHHQNRFDAFTPFCKCYVHNRLEKVRLSSSISSIGGDDELCARVLYAIS